ncbi:lactam utilization protein LamB [Virgibacillus profundi]|uniref:5-oxoprolinase subunit A n=1 Tax=Virgibacillus profundi TaxID=2024555 RepID=A0A2A2IIM2_9BACI|nr:5-oxoprolinase subunit PxpA [Virgibacillus profundi]PAV30990.1 lactam utilization protein LamB [Virgibacillus profundi]PXY55175.1 LamB/YcsF family protein [Virgibacillus profundi]
MGKRIDLNTDMGESFGTYTFGADEKLLKHITTANIACGFHAGDPNVMDQTVQLAKKYNVAIGAHPGFPDVAGFGRRMIEFTPDEIYRLVAYQIGGLQAFCRIHGVKMQHVKPHGALYNLAARNREVADAIAKAVKDIDPSFILFGPAGSELLEAGKRSGLQVAAEVFADRTYQPDGSLTSRFEKDSMIEDVDIAAAQIEQIIKNGVVKAVNGELVAVEADTVCVHGDGPHAVGFVKKLREMLDNAGVEVVALSKQESPE